MMRERNFGFILWVAFFFYFSVCVSNCEEDGKNRQTYVIRYKDGEQTIPVTVVLDYKKQTEYVINMNPRTPAKSVTLYDFKQRTIAYKDLTNRECFLGRLTHETLNEESNALQDVKNPVEVRPKIRSLDPRKPALTPTEIRNIAGQKTAVFCRKMNTWLLVPEKDHSISKRQVGEYEERTYQYHGHRSSQYSHYERESRRRYRNRNQPNARRRSQRKQGEANYENNGLGIRERNAHLPAVNIEAENDLQFNPRHPLKVNTAGLQNHSSVYQVPLNTPHLDQTNAYGNKGNDISFANRLPSSTLNTNENPKYPKDETKSLSAAEIRHHPKYSLHELNSNETERTDYELIPDLSKNTSRHFKKSTSLEKIISDDTNGINERTTTTTGPYIPFGQTGYPNVHFSLVHLLPLYKPLGQEFETEQETSTGGYANNLQPNLQRTIESEIHPLPTSLIESSSVSHDPDVSSNIVNVPKLTNEFEKLKENNTYLPLPHSGNVKHVHNSVESYPLSPRSPHFRKNDFQKESIEPVSSSPKRGADSIAKETYFRGSDIHSSQTESSTTTQLPILTTRDYSAVDATTSNPLYIPSVHTAFQNSEDFNTFQIFPNFIENTDQTALGRNLNAHSDNDDNRDDRTRVAQNLVSTTDYPLEKHRIDRNNRSDTSNEGSKSQLSTSTHIAIDTHKDSHSPLPNDTIEANSPPYKIRYQSVLRDFKPDEIVIDIENIPTHTPAPFTDRYQQRFHTTVQPTVQSFSSNGIKNYTDRRSEQVAGTTWRSLNPTTTTTTRYPRRRISDNSRRPIQNSSISFTQRHSLNHVRYQTPKYPVQANRFIGASPFSSTHHNNRRPFHYPSRPIPPSHVVLPPEVNHLPHINNLNNLPPGVSVHPRHPQAPLADMVRSNRPPTMPFVNDNQVFMKPHRERHHRKKERYMHSCCRLRGQSTAFQSCCRNGGSCCSRSRRRMQPSPSNCCSSSNGVGQIIPSKQVQPPVRITNQTLPPIRTEKTHRSEVDNTDRCQREKMCRTLYESTQQVMVCRNAHIEGC